MVPKHLFHLFVKFAVILTTACFIKTTLCVSLVPADHLIPPPLPSAQRYTHNALAGTRPEVSSHHKIHTKSNSKGEQNLITRVARWFGTQADGLPREQQLPLPFDPKHTYSKGNSNKQDSKKEACDLCMKYPWVPMMFPSQEFPLQQREQQHQQQQQQQHNQNAGLQAQAQTIQTYYEQHPFKDNAQRQQHAQRSVQFNFPTLPLEFNPTIQQQQQAAQLQKHPEQLEHEFAPIDYQTSNYLPTAAQLGLSVSPPLYNAIPFNPISSPPTTQTFQTEQELPSTEYAHFTENVGAHSELQFKRVPPTPQSALTIPPADGGKVGGTDGVEIIKSQQISHYVSSVEYPFTFVQSQAIDLDINKQTTKAAQEVNSVNAVDYRELNLVPNPSKHTPASEILTLPTGFDSPQHSSLQSISPISPISSLESQNQEQFNAIPQTHTETTTSSSTLSSDYPSGDNFPSASSHNLTKLHSIGSGLWDAEQNEVYYTTIEPPNHKKIPNTPSEVSVPHADFNFVLPELESTQETHVEFVPSVSLPLHIFQDASSTVQHNRDRETPKRFLDSPILHSHIDNEIPRPYTKDPSKLSLRLVGPVNVAPQEFQHSNHAYSDEAHTKAAWLVLATPPTLKATAMSAAAAAPTPTSNYSAIDASGQFAGMVPPAAANAHSLQQLSRVPQILIPYTTKNRPRPFEVTSSMESTTAGNQFLTWSEPEHAQLQEESKLVHSATEVPPKSRLTAKYLTKILASNLRELLKHEQEQKNRSKSPHFDLSKLQNNIDDWTVQEYTSISHLPSTPTIRGRSKHIPTEYLTTTIAPYTQTAKTTKAPPKRTTSTLLGLSSSINSLDADQTEINALDDNSVFAFFDTKVLKKERDIVSTTTTTATTVAETTPKSSFIPYYAWTAPVKNETELWQEAKVVVSPQTKEKVYVVTPQPRFFQQRMLETSTPSAALVNTARQVNAIQSPRFAVRPTPGNNTTSKPSSLYSPDIFGLFRLSSYVPEKPIEIIDGNSKVVTATTASAGSSNNHNKFSEKKRMSPLPR